MVGVVCLKIIYLSYEIFIFANYGTCFLPLCSVLKIEECKVTVEYYLLSHVHIRFLLLMFSEFVSHSTDISLWNLVDVSDNSQLGSDERVVRKMEKIKRLAREAATGNAQADENLMSPEDREEVQRLKEALQETRAASLREREQAEVSTVSMYRACTGCFHITYIIKR